MDIGGPAAAWSVLGLLLLVSSVGMSGVLTLLLSLLLTIFTVLVTFLLTNYAQATVDQTVRCSRVKSTVQARLQRRVVTTSSYRQSVMTGSSATDKPLQDMIGFIIRDYVTSWYNNISHNSAFPDELRAILCMVVTLITERIYVVDWVPFLTRNLVDTIATHVRLFKNARNKYNSPIKDGEARPADLETIFFNYEAEMEGDVCRDAVCYSKEGESLYFQELCELLLYLVLPKHEFQAGPVRCLTREILSSVVIQPSFSKLSEPDFVNQSLVWLYMEYEIKSDVFVHTLRHTENMMELEATRDLVTKEISRLRSCDSVSDDEDGGRLQLNSLLYLKKVIDTKISRLQSGFSGNSYGIPANIDWSGKINPNTKLFNLPLEVILKNNIALSYFIDYMTSINCQHIVFFYLNIEGWKVSAEQQIQAMEVEFLKTGSNDKYGSYMETMREAALSIYQEYLSDKANPRISVEDSLNKKLLLRIRSESPDPTWFDEVAAYIHQQLEKTEKFMKDFKRSVGYLKLLAELDLLKGELEDDEDISIGESASLNSYDGSYKSVSKSDGSSGGEGADSPSLGVPSVHSVQTGDLNSKSLILHR